MLRPFRQFMPAADPLPLLDPQVRRELGLALVQRERLLERICLGVYALIDAKLIAKMRRTTFGTWLRVSRAKQWLVVFAKYGVIQASFKPVDLVEQPAPKPTFHLRAQSG